MKNIALKKISLCGLFSALALISFIVEGLFTPLIIPGAKIGISNIFILLSTICLGWTYGYATLLIKVILGSLFAGNASAIIYSLPAGVISLTLQIFCLYFIKKASITCISIIGAVTHITIQNVLFCLYTLTTEYLVYLPYLALIGILGGTITGLSVYLTIKRLPEKYINFTLTSN